MKRQRGRGRKSNGQQNRNFESNGPDIKIRGSASHVYDKYQQLARDAASSGDRIAAESYLQHAEHYFRVMRSQQQFQQRDRPEEGGMREAQQHGGGYHGGYSNGRDETEDFEGGELAPAPAGAPAGGPLDVVDPEAAEGQAQPVTHSSGGEREEGRSRRPRRQRRRYEGGGGDHGGGNGGGNGGEPAVAAPSPSLDG
jgi:hypothetical protein